VLLGGSQEKGVRPGTVGATLAAGFGVAAKIAAESPSRWANAARLRDGLEEELLALGASVAGKNAPLGRAPHVVNTIWKGWIGAELVAALDLEGLSVSSGAACSAGTVEPSPVLATMMDADLATRGVRLSLGDTTTQEDIDRAIVAFRAVLAR
jgi:cysteine desulfurase